MQVSTNLTSKDGEDVAASIFLLFGDPYKILGPDREPIPALRYVWSGGPEDVGSSIDNPYLPGMVKSIILRGRDAETKTWVTERHNPFKDYEAAFGKPSSEPIQGLILFTDNLCMGKNGMLMKSSVSAAWPNLSPAPHVVTAMVLTRAGSSKFVITTSSLTVSKTAQLNCLSLLWSRPSPAEPGLTTRRPSIRRTSCWWVWP